MERLIVTTTQTPSKRPSGMFGLTVVLAGQAISILASSMTGFALSIWVFQKTSSATSLGIMQTAFVLPYLLIIPLAGVMVDRYNRKLMMMVSDLAAGLGTLAILILSFSSHLQVWHFYVINVVIGLGNAFQWPAYSAAITTMVPKEQYGRANGMMTFVQAGPGVVAPLLAGALMPHIGLNGILVIDVATFLFAIGVLMIVHIPPPVKTVEGQEGKGSLLQEAAFGFKYIFKRPSLLGYVMMLFVANLFLGFPNRQRQPDLRRSGNGGCGLMDGRLALNERVGRSQAPHAWSLVRLGVLLPLWEHPLCIGQWLGDMDSCHPHWRTRGKYWDRHQSSHPASESCPRCAGTRLFRPPHVDLVS
jgi:MFS family permease